jgi:hypothetical protein
LQKKAYAEIFSSIPCQITEIFGKKVGFLGPGLTATCGRNFFFEKCLFAKIVKKNFSLFYLASPEIIGVQFGDRQTESGIP